MTQEALKRVAEKLRRAGASLPAPELTGTIEGSVVTGLCIALALVETEIEALADPMREVQRLGQEIEPKIGCVNHDCDQCKAQPEQEPVFTYEQVKAHIQVAMMSTTTPPRRTWVGLTLEQYVAINCSCTTVDQAVGSTERQLKENNT